MADLQQRLVVPKNIEAERALLSCIIIDPNVIYNIKVKPEWFYKPEHKQVWLAIHRLVLDSKPIDLLAIKEQLRTSNKLDEVGGEDFLSSLASDEFIPENTPYYTSLIKDSWVLRNIIDIGTTCIETGYNPAVKAKVAKERITSMFQNFENDDDVGKTFSLGDLVTKEWDDLHFRIENPDKIGLMTGFNGYDLLSGGLHPQDMIIFAARPGVGKCLGKGTKVFMYDGTLRKVEDVVAGDLLMGDDSTPRKVLSIARGKENMYWVKQNKGISYRVNESHILSLKRSRNKYSIKHGEIVNISVKDYITKSDKFKNNYKGYKVAVDFSHKEIPIEPYLLGLWLGDGKTSNSIIYNTNNEVVEYLYNYADKHDLEIHKYEQDGKCPGYRIAGFTTELNRYSILYQKHIPRDYINNSREVRLEILAGLLDTDGNVIRDYGYEITQKSKILIDDIKLLADTLGFRTRVTEKIGTIKSIGFEGLYYRLTIFGDVYDIPVKIKYKKLYRTNKRVDWTVTGIKVEFDKYDDYYGFEIDGNKLFLLEDMTVTHNTALVLKMLLNLAKNGVGSYLWEFEMGRSQIVQRLAAIESGVNLTRIVNGTLSQVEYNKVTAGLKRLQGLPIYIETDVSANVYDIMTQTRRMVNKHGIKIMALDHIQLVPSGGEDQTQEIGNISRQLKKVAMELDITCMVVSQLNRAVERRDDKRPNLSDLRQSGNLEENADQVVFLYREDYYEKKADNIGTTELIIAKHRNGPLGNLPLIFHAETADYFELGKRGVED